MRKITVLVPVYNQENNIIKCIENILGQAINNIELELIIVDDGSIDNTWNICKKISQNNENIILFRQNHKGVSSARNYGLKNATGKYIFFLDADDEFGVNTLQSVTDFFEQIDSSVDLVTYNIKTIYDGKVLEPHFRYKYLKESGVYDYLKEPYIGQTTMNIVVRNKFKNNVLFNEAMQFSEDQDYCCRVIQNSLKIGYCDQGEYIYYRSKSSSSGKLAGACYIFEQSMKMFEDLFSCYENVPLAFQGLYVNDIYWKLVSNILYPYHYNQDDFERALCRIKKLLEKCYPFVILNHPNIDYYEKFYLMRLKNPESIEPFFDETGYGLLSEGNVVCREEKAEFVMTQFSVSDNSLLIRGFIKSVLFQFYHQKLDFYVIEKRKGKTISKKQALFDSTHNYYLSHTKSQRFKAICYETDLNDLEEIGFKIIMGGNEYCIKYYFMPLVPFSNDLKHYQYQSSNYLFSITEDNLIKIQRNSVDNTEKKIWLYYDCQGVECDNGMLQFLHDSKKRDHIDRYYVITDKNQKRRVRWHKTVLFGSEKHRKLFQKASIIVTAFIENDNIIPYGSDEYDSISNEIHFKVIYLQHGVFHIDMPWKYSPERIIADKIVVSTDVDYELFIKNGYLESELLKIGMPRLDGVYSTNKSKNKILFAPSWRNYLAVKDSSTGWKVIEGSFYSSNYFNEIKSFLESKELLDILKINGYTLDVKLHPIFNSINLKIELDNKYIKRVNRIKESDYGLLITDFSSYMYDFIYRKIPMLSFIPDFEEFKCGMNGYKNVDYIDKVGEDKICTNHKEIIKGLQYFFKYKQYLDYQVNYFGKDNERSEMIYERLLEE